MDNNFKQNDRRIVKNSIMLYFRQFICMGISFFTTRELLATLGVDNYGLVNVISGVVTMFSFVSNLMTSASSRFLTYYLGCDDYEYLKKVFNLTQLIYILVFLVILLFGETIGLYVFYNKIIIPPERINVCVYFYQFSVFAFLFKMLSIPYQSLIVAHENMATYSMMSILDHIFKLVSVYIVKYSNSIDLLFLYGILLVSFSFLYLLIYCAYCMGKYHESRYKFYWNKELFKEIMNFSGWNLFGAASNLFSDILVNILLNNYFGAVVNAARSISMHVSVAVSSFMQSFLTAVKPQITKYWASGNKTKMYQIAESASKFGFFLVLLISLPAIYETKFFLQCWLKSIPEYSLIFTKLVIISILIDTITYPLITVNQATGKVALYQSVVAGTTWLNFPLSWLCLAYGCKPESTFWVLISLRIVCLFLRVIIVGKIANFSRVKFFKNVVFKCISVSLIPICVLYFRFIFDGIKYRSIIIICACIIFTFISIITIGLTKSELSSIKELVVNKLGKLGICKC